MENVKRKDYYRIWNKKMGWRYWKEKWILGDEWIDNGEKDRYNDEEFWKKEIEGMVRKGKIKGDWKDERNGVKRKWKIWRGI